VQRALRATIRDVDRKRPLASTDGDEVRNVPIEARQPQQAFHEATSTWSLGPVAFHASIWRSAIPKSTFMVRHVWMAASLNVRDLPLLPEGSASQFIPGSNQIVSDPRRFSAAL